MEDKSPGNFIIENELQKPSLILLDYLVSKKEELVRRVDGKFRLNKITLRKVFDEGVSEMKLSGMTILM